MGRTFQLLVQSTATCDAQGTNELLEIDGSVLVLVEHVEYVVGKVARITEGEELLVYSAELRLVQLTRWAILEEAFVPVRGRDIVSKGGLRRGSRRQMTIAAVRACQLERR